MAETATDPGASELNVTDLEKRVKQMYHEVALTPDKEFHFETGRELAERLGYPPDELSTIPAGAIESFAGVGYFFDLADIQPGEVIVDVGSGSGMDSLLASRQTGDSGWVIGVDMTDAQLHKARQVAAAGDIENVTFNAGHVERMPVEDEVADVVISNGVFNLVPDKPLAFHEAARVLRPGGRLAIADIVTDQRLPSGVKCDASLWAACIGGAMQTDDYRGAIESSGFDVEVMRTNGEYQFLSDSAANATAKWGVTSISLLARRR